MINQWTFFGGKLNRENVEIYYEYSTGPGENWITFWKIMMDNDEQPITLDGLSYFGSPVLRRPTVTSHLAWHGFSHSPCGLVGTQMFQVNQLDFIKFRILMFHLYPIT